MVDNIKVDLREIVWKGKEGFDLAHGRDKLWDFVKTVMNFQSPINCGEFLELLRNFQLQKNAVSSCFKDFNEVVLNSYFV
jgi:hypothetical protein